MNSKILIVEDDHQINTIYTMKLKKEGFEAISAFDGAEGLKLAEEKQPDIILLDLLMPVMDGEEMLRELRNTDWGEHIKVLILTNISKDEAPLGLRSLHIEDYLVKALYTPTQIVEKIRKVLNN